MRVIKHDCVPLWGDGLVPSINAYCAFNAAGPLSGSCNEGSAGAFFLREVGWPKMAIEWADDKESNKWQSLRLTGWIADTIVPSCLVF